MGKLEKISEDVIESCKDRIVEVVKRYLPDLTKAGAEYEACCPFHDERSPSFKLNEAKRFFYCLAAETGVITPEGVFPISSLSGRTHKVLTKGGAWVDAPFDSYGVQRLWKLSISRNGVKKDIFATGEHRWFVRDRSSAIITSDLKPGHRLQSVFPAERAHCEMSKDGLTHGVVFGDGTMTNGNYGIVALHGSKASELGNIIEARSKKVRTTQGGAEYLQCYGGLDYAHMKRLPSLSVENSYLLGWLAGYFATDGHVAKDGTVMLNSSVRENLEFARAAATRLGIGTYGITSQSRTGYCSEPSDIFRIHFMNSTLDASFFLCEEDRKRFARSNKIFERTRWVVESVEETDRVEEVFCAYVPETHSFAIEDNILTGNCFGCGASGSAIDFVMGMENVNFPEAVRRIAGNISTVTAPKREKPPVEPPDWQPIIPIPDDLSVSPPDVFKRRDGALKLSARWEYRDAAGQLIGYVCRFNKPEGGKEVVPQTWCVNTKTGEAAWRWQSFPEPRPLYGLDKLAANPKAQVILVEGEKKVDAGYKHAEAAGISADKLVFAAWPGGGKAVEKIDWSPLYGRSLGLWPDNDQKDYPERHPKAGQKVPFLDQPGIAAMLAVFDKLQSHCPSIKFIVPPDGTPCGWDIADEFPPGVTLIGHARSAAIPAASVRERFAVIESEPEPVEPPFDDSGLMDTAEPPEAAPSAPTDEVDDFDTELTRNRYFTILGMNEGRYYVFMHEKQQIMTISKGQINEIGLIELAPLSLFWESYFPKEKGGVDVKSAADWFFRTANSRGIYDLRRVRGRGAWRDDGRNVYHHGNYLTVDGEAMSISSIKSEYVYPAAPKLPSTKVEPLTDAEGKWLAKVAGMVRFTMPGSAALMSGWVMLAPICGALTWRSHIWLTGPAGSGKSTVQGKFCAALLRDVGQYFSGDSTEAGIRQDLKADALPVLIDEIESNNERDKQRVEAIVGLVRKTSTESNMRTAKGTVSGDSQTYKIRSMFCLASINTNLPTKADIDRLTVLSIKKAKEDDGGLHWKILEGELNRIDCDPTISNRLLARALSMMPVILESVNVFRRVAAGKFGTQRDGDQFGTLLAGCWCLQNSVVPTDEQALAMFDSYEWAEHTEDHDQDESEKALTALLSAKIRMPHEGDLTVYELIRESMTGGFREGVIDQSKAEAALRRHGILVEQASGSILFGTSVPTLVELIEKTPFSTGLRAQLLRIPGATRYDDVKSFNGIKSRPVSIPISRIMMGDSPNDYPL